MYSDGFESFSIFCANCFLLRRNSQYPYLNNISGPGCLCIPYKNYRYSTVLQTQLCPETSFKTDNPYRGTRHKLQLVPFAIALVICRLRGTRHRSQRVPFLIHALFCYIASSFLRGPQQSASEMVSPYAKALPITRIFAESSEPIVAPDLFCHTLQMIFCSRELAGRSRHWLGA
jgi:hypothetical protein